MALHGLKVIEFAGLAPAPMCGMLLSDFGAIVTKIDKVSNNSLDILQNGKRKLALNLKSKKGQGIVKELCKNSDVLIDPYRPGVLEKLGLGPNILLEENKKLIYARITGFGQTGPMALDAGHDINYVAMSGLLSLLGRKNEKPTPPINYAADFAGGGLLCAFGICIALLERVHSGKGQIVDCSMTEGTAYVASWLMRSQNQVMFGNKRGENILDTGAHFYETYETKDGKYIAVGAIESQFYSILMDKLNLKLEQYSNFNENKKILENIFREKTQKEWCDIFQNTDACVTPVLELENIHEHPQHAFRNTFQNKNKNTRITCPNPAPILSRTPGVSSVEKPEINEFDDVCEILKEIGLKSNDIKSLYEEGVILLSNKPKL